MTIFARIADTLEADFVDRPPGALGPRGNWSTWLYCGGRGRARRAPGPNGCAPSRRPPASPVLLSLGRRRPTCGTLWSKANGLMSICPNSNRPIYEPSKRRLTWPNGVQAALFSSEEPRGCAARNRGRVVRRIGGVATRSGDWSTVQFGLRLGKPPRQVVTTTPKPIKLLRDTDREHGRDVSDAGHDLRQPREPCADSFFSQIVTRYEGTRIGRQELNAEFLEDAEGALWAANSWRQSRHDPASMPPPSGPSLWRLIRRFRPARISAETGLIVAGLGVDGHAYVLEDGSANLLPIDWARRAVALYRKYGTPIASWRRRTRAVRWSRRRSAWWTQTCRSNWFMRLAARLRARSRSPL